MKLTAKQMRKAVDDAAKVDIHPDDIDEFAYRIDQLCAPLGTVVWLKVETNREKEPNLKNWIEPTLKDWEAVKNMTETQAKKWFILNNRETWEKYGPGIPKDVAAVKSPDTGYDNIGMEDVV